ncbi:hypothetical protein HG535_0H02270 [Zygotorulaspora mrakii]|uniref:DDHD domain-containing protein n=1 Tax=Zygotorulaspora mrakii TaxID=42260 RepID=A0A7H9B8X8_ZYGMR|nr:uncharacterized protein HG535_0H02270 [Zygotorulaspora mrakii]QLG74900.1 hypothetical protein HG535_0H02270 [Zygotorulaspora mrakii]
MFVRSCTRHSQKRLISCRSARLREQVRQRPWFYATDVPKTKPYEADYKPDKLPKQFIKFSNNDSKRLEVKYQQGKAKQGKNEGEKVPVNEDFLFEVDIAKMELRPTYWEGPVYEVRRGIWFDSANNPVKFDLTNELEEYYLKVNFEKDNDAESVQDIFRLSKDYGDFKFVIFLDAKTACLLPELEGGELQLKLLRANVLPLLATKGTKITRGLSENAIAEAAEKAKTAIGNEVATTTKNLGSVSDLISWELPSVFGVGTRSKKTDQNTKKLDQEDDNVLKREIEKDYENVLHNKREAKHLVLSVHGIGQNLGKKYEYVNFAHTINLLRSNMKKIYKQSKNLQKLNEINGFDDHESNCNVQVLPITWRHTIGFQTDAKKPHDSNPHLPTLGNITVNGVLGLRRLLGDVALDILLYGERYYKEKIINEVGKQLNHVYGLFKKNNPGFETEVHLLGHSLGSLILFDILSDPKMFKLDFKVNKFFCIGSPVGVFKLIQRTQIRPKGIPHNNDPNKKFETPDCQDLYNLFHVCDPIAYRLEPLVHNTMGEVEQAHITHWSDNSTIASRVLELGGYFLKDNDKQKKLSRGKDMLTTEASSLLSKLNHTGRVDYSLPSGFLEVDIISAAKSHVSYFEEMDIAGFILKQILSDTPHK